MSVEVFGGIGEGKPSRYWRWHPGGQSLEYLLETVVSNLGDITPTLEGNKEKNSPALRLT